MITFTVFGIPQPQGSMRAFTPKGWKRPIITADNAKTKPYRQEVAGMAQAEMRSRQPVEREEPIRVEISFYFQRPASLRKGAKHKTTKPDLDKLARSVLDAMTGIVFEDDSQVTELVLTKGFGTAPQTVIRVTRLAAQEQLRVSA